MRVLAIYSISLSFKLGKNGKNSIKKLIKLPNLGYCYKKPDMKIPKNKKTRKKHSKIIIKTNLMLGLILTLMSSKNPRINKEMTTET